MPTAARRAALDLLLELERGRATLDLLLAGPLLASLPRLERNFVNELVLGTLRRRGAIDHALRAFVDRPLPALDAVVLACLRLAAHQLLHLRVPPRAAVDESVELARQAGLGRASGFVNAVLRRLARDGPPALPDADREPLAWLTSAGSLPEWLALRWLAALGPGRACARAGALLAVPTKFFRLNPRAPEAARRVAADGVEWRAERLPGLLVLTSGDLGPSQAAGLVYPQDLGAQLAAHLAASGGGPLLDGCAAPGGKALLAADLLGGGVVALERSRRRLRTLRELARRWGGQGLQVVGGDAARPPLRGGFATVLLDAPCSGLGTLARHPDIRWRATPDDLPRQAARQRALLDGLAPLVRPGGLLVYSVCSLEPEEGPALIRHWLAGRPGFSLAEPPAWAGSFVRDGLVATAPEHDEGEGFFAALLRRA
jgi:16S rRNA (cytosine967-C5)-methyltransferase